MNFYSVCDLRTETKNLWDNLSADGEVVITNNGKPAALMINIPTDCFDEVVQAVRQAKAMIAFNNMRSCFPLFWCWTPININTSKK